MAIVSARVVTIISVIEARDQILKGIESFGLRAYSTHRIRGRGAHGRRMGGFFESENVSFVVVTSPAMALKLLTWVDDEVSKIHPAIAYSAGADAVPGDHFT